MANHDIIIRAAKPNAHQPDKSFLELSDGGETNAKGGDTVTWIVEDKAITSIIVMDDNRNANVFAPDPKPVGGGSKDWSGKTKPVTRKEEETYTICWAQGGQVYCYDPKIVVNP